jgi:hypothetical protein
MRRAWHIGLCLLAPMFSGCETPVEEEVLRQAYQLGLEDRWEEVRPLVRPYVLAHPNDPGAHLLWGLCHSRRLEAWIIIAEGEFGEALDLFDARKEVGALGSLLSPDEFQAVVHCESARTALRSIREGLKAGAPRRVIKVKLEKAVQHVDTGLRLDPTSHLLQEMKKTLTALFSGASSGGA